MAKKPWHQAVPDLPVQDVIRARSYYCEYLGFKEAWLLDDHSKGAVHRDELVLFFTACTSQFTKQTHWIFSEDVDGAFSELRAYGAKIVAPLENKSWGLRQFTFEDLDGHKFHMYHDL